MQLISTHQVKPSNILAKNIYTNSGIVLLGKGAELTTMIVRRLEDLGIHLLYVENEMTNDIVVQDIISDETRRYALETVSQVILKMSDKKNDRQISDLKLGKQFHDVVKTIVDDVRSQPRVLINLANIYATDDYIYHHSVNVTVLSLAMGMGLGFNSKQLTELGIGSILHDIGKTKTPSAILHKPDKLTDEEWEIMKQHSADGYEMLRQEPEISVTSAHIAYQHHERYNGSGYPRGLAGNEIHPYARIVAVADTYDALVGNRTYRKAFLPHQAIELLLGSGNFLYDYEVIKVFVDRVALYPIGMTVTLDTGEKGIVIHNTPGRPQRPLLRMIENASGETIDPYELDLQ
ncbi:MAG: HD-GYP domain-containing protein, partial [Bacilli bacterium]